MERLSWNPANCGYRFDYAILRIDDKQPDFSKASRIGTKYQVTMSINIHCTKCPLNGRIVDIGAGEDGTRSKLTLAAMQIVRYQCKGM